MPGFQLLVLFFCSCLSYTFLLSLYVSLFVWIVWASLMCTISISKLLPQLLSHNTRTFVFENQKLFCFCLPEMTKKVIFWVRFRVISERFHGNRKTEVSGDKSPKSPLFMSFHLLQLSHRLLFDSQEADHTFPVWINKQCA